jgi:hypothetical protein
VNVVAVRSRPSLTSAEFNAPGLKCVDQHTNAILCLTASPISYMRYDKGCAVSLRRFFILLFVKHILKLEPTLFFFHGCADGREEAISLAQFHQA